MSTDTPTLTGGPRRLLDRLDRVDLTSTGAHALADRRHLPSPTADQIADAETVVDAVGPQIAAALVALVDRALSRPQFLAWVAAQPPDDPLFVPPVQLLQNCVRDALGIDRR